MNKISPMTGFEPRTSGIGNGCSANWATTKVRTSSFRRKFTWPVVWGPTLAFIAIPPLDCRLGGHTLIAWERERGRACSREREIECVLQAVYGRVKKGQLYQSEKEIKRDKEAERVFWTNGTEAYFNWWERGTLPSMKKKCLRSS